VVACAERSGYENAVVAHGSLVGGSAHHLTLERCEPSRDPAQFSRLMNGYRHLRRQAWARLPLSNAAPALAALQLPALS
jgi:hypothetical protein